MRRRARLQRSWFSHWAHQLRSPYYRYHNARYLHAVRVGVAMLCSIALTSMLGIPHGFWASVTLLVVIGGLQHHGNIRRKAFERSIATGLGALLGLALIVQHHAIGSYTLTYLLMAALAGICAYHAVGKAGYIGLLTAITLSIVAGHGDNAIDIGLWRTFNVAIGTVLALLFSFAFPLYATYDWRFRLAENLRECARLYPRIMTGEPMGAKEQVDNFARLSGRLVQLRSLIPPVAKELQIAPGELEEVQRLHRTVISALEMLAASAEGTQRAQWWGGEASRARRSTVRWTLLAMSRALRSGNTRQLQRMAERAAQRDNESPPDAALPYEMQGSHWLAQRLSEQVRAMSTIIGRMHLK